MMVKRQGAVRVLLGTLALLAFAAPARAQNPTPEGTVITNTATVTYSDANANAYAPVSASVSVTVAFQAGVRVTGGENDVPMPGVTGQTMAFTIENIGNGTDQFQLSATNSDPAVMSVTGFVHEGTTYGTLAALNAVLVGLDVAMGGTVSVTLTYDVPAGTGGEAATYQLTAASVRDGTMSDGDAGTVSPSKTYAVTVTPDGLAGNVERLPSNGGVYSATFTVANGGSGTETFDLSAPGGALVAVSAITVDGAAATTVTIASAASRDVVVEYTLADGAAGATEDLTLTATSQGDAAVSDAGHVTVERVKATVAITKRAFDATRTSEITEVTPGAFIEYQITVTNSGKSEATSVVVVEELDSDYLTYVSTQAGTGSWRPFTTGTNGDGNAVVTAELDTALAAGASATFWVRAQVR